MPHSKILYGAVTTEPVDSTLEDYQDFLLNRPLQEGTPVIVRWPDGDEEQFNVQVIGYIAYITVYYCNHPIRLILRHLNLPVAFAS